MLNDPDDEQEVREVAGLQFIADKNATQKAMPELIGALRKAKKSTFDMGTLNILQAISRTRPPKGALPVLADFIEDNEELVAQYAIRAIAAVGPDARILMPKIVAAIDKGCPLEGEIRSGIVHDPESWEPILLTLFGRDAAIQRIRDRFGFRGTDAEQLRQAVLRLEKR